jgi:hypothetical protein
MSHMVVVTMTDTTAASVGHDVDSDTTAALAGNDVDAHDDQECVSSNAEAMLSQILSMYGAAADLDHHPGVAAMMSRLAAMKYMKSNFQKIAMKGL